MILAAVADALSPFGWDCLIMDIDNANHTHVFSDIEECLDCVSSLPGFLTRVIRDCIEGQ